MAGPRLSTAPRRSACPTRRPRMLIVEARYYDDIADELLAGAGALEAGRPSRVAHRAGRAGDPGHHRDRARRGRGAPAGPMTRVVALGCVIRGETSHYDIVAGESARALMDLVGRAPAAARQRHPDGRERGAGLGPRPGRRDEQGRRRGRGGARACCAQAPPRGGEGSDHGDGEARQALRRPARRRAGALPDGGRRQGRHRRRGRVRGALDRPRGRGRSSSSRPKPPSSATSSRGVVQRAARSSTRWSTRRSPRAGR